MDGRKEENISANTAWVALKILFLSFFNKTIYNNLRHYKFIIFIYAYRESIGCEMKRKQKKNCR